jgi:hypothetical protein
MVIDTKKQRTDIIYHKLLKYEDGKNYILDEILPGLNIKDHSNFDELDLINYINTGEKSTAIDKNNLFFHPTGFYFYITRFLLMNDTNNQFPDFSAIFEFCHSHEMPKFNSIISFIIGFSDKNWFIVPYNKFVSYKRLQYSTDLLTISADKLHSSCRTFNGILHEDLNFQTSVCLFLELLTKSQI